ncbi:MAG: hypothetical protein U9N31_01635 [Candidatus Marinimicrobia bacterium]|mgnify:CR=1 FL=1|nr:hypothetical protein [Candidatus Neomarinimicrobiota bacterium]
MNFNSLSELLLNHEPIPELVPVDIWNFELTSHINNLDAVPLIKAGLHLLNDNIEGCHVIVQDDSTPNGSYWHAILHRRESDYWNSKYWYRRVGNHPVIDAMKFEYPRWDPFDFVDQCEQNAGSNQERLQEIQYREMIVLFNQLSPNSL